MLLLILLSLNGWINGLSSLFFIILGWVFGLYFILSSRRQKSKLLRNFGLGMIFFSNMYISYVTDFFFLLFRGQHPWWIWTYIMISEVDLLRCLTTWMWTPFSMYVAALIGAEVVLPRRKTYFKLFFLISGIIYELILFLDFGNNLTHFVEVTPGDLADSYYTFGSPIFWLVMTWFLLILLLNGFIILKALQVKGVIRKKLLTASISFIILFLIIGVFEGFTTPGPVIILIRIIMIITWFLIYYGIKPSKEKKRKKKAPSEEIAKLASFMLGKAEKVEELEQTSLQHKAFKENLLVFVSYATKDVNTFKVHDIAKKLNEFPEIENVLYWEEHMEDNIFEYMDENLEKCDVMILFCSENAKDSVPVKKEWTAAEALGKPIVPVFYDPNHIPALLSSRLGIQFDFYDMQENIIKLRNLIVKKVKGLTQ